MASTTSENAQRYVRIASTLCYVQCVFLALSAIALGIPPLATRSDHLAISSVIVAVMLSEGILFGVAARGLRRFRRPSAFLAAGMTVAATATQLAMTRSVLNVWLAVNLATVGLIVLGWPLFSTPDVESVKPDAGARLRHDSIDSF